MSCKRKKKIQGENKGRERETDRQTDRDRERERPRGTDRDGDRDRDRERSECSGEGGTRAVCVLDEQAYVVGDIRIKIRSRRSVTDIDSSRTRPNPIQYSLTHFRAMHRWPYN